MAGTTTLASSPSPSPSPSPATSQAPSVPGGRARDIASQHASCAWKLDLRRRTGRGDKADAGAHRASGHGRGPAASCGQADWKRSVRNAEACRGNFEAAIVRENAPLQRLTAAWKRI